ncbi:SDR family oxidoreductase [Nanoarchaeota archaeon]
MILSIITLRGCRSWIKISEQSKIIITGASGLLGSTLVDYLRRERPDYELFCLYNTHKIDFNGVKNLKIDLKDSTRVSSLEEINPDLIVHCGALTNISYCEAHQSESFETNVIGTRNIARLSKKANCKLIYISTDSIFDGEKGDYSESDVPNPLHVYGETKVKGEEECLKANEDSLLLRTNMFGRNFVSNKLSFVDNVIKTLSEGKEFNGFVDAKFCPLFVGTLSKYIIDLYERDQRGIMNCASSEKLAKFDFVKLVAKEFGFDENLVKQSSITSVCGDVKRPKDTSLNNSKMLKVLGIKSTPTMLDMLQSFKKSIENKE